MTPVTGPCALVIGASLALAACGGGSDGGGSGDTGSAPASSPGSSGVADDGKVDCALAGSGTFEHVCVVERKTVDGALILIVRHPDGGFRRFEVVSDGRGVITADGAQNATVVPGDARIDVTVGSDRYHFPATISNAGG